MLLGVIAMRIGEGKLNWDAQAGRFTNNDEANAHAEAQIPQGLEVRVVGGVRCFWPAHPDRLLCLSRRRKAVITPADGVPPVGPYSPGTPGRRLSVRLRPGRGEARRHLSPRPPRNRRRRCLTNVRRIVEAAGLTMEHVVYAHVYMKDLAGVDGMNRAWRAAFPANPPARVVLGVAKMPVDTPVEVTVVAVRDLAAKRTIRAFGVRIARRHDRRSPVHLGLSHARRHGRKC